MGRSETHYFVSHYFYALKPTEALWMVRACEMVVGRRLCVCVWVCVFSYMSVEPPPPPLCLPDSALSSKMRTVALKQNSKCPCWEPLHRPKETPAHSTSLLCDKCVFVVRTSLLMCLTYHPDPPPPPHPTKKISSIQIFSRPPEEWLSP